VLPSSVHVATVNFSPRSITGTTACSLMASLLILVEFYFFNVLDLFWCCLSFQYFLPFYRPSPLPSPHLIVLSHWSVMFFVGRMLYTVRLCYTEAVPSMSSSECSILLLTFCSTSPVGSGVVLIMPCLLEVSCPVPLIHSCLLAVRAGDVFLYFLACYCFFCGTSGVSSLACGFVSLVC